ncbi:MFS-type transporter SLC18B1-like, partial [Diadema antillarum]|uniref:MFS-type transporter SLC18B1-like n=1 Tax=Diadema antillarum TaxID=105358 RepID=UPI003A8ACBE7
AQTVGSDDGKEVVGGDHGVESEGEETKPRHITLRQKLTFAGIAIMYMSSLMSFSVLAPFFPNEAEKKGVSPAETGFIFGFFALVSFICSPILGKYLPVIGAKFMFLSGSFLSAGCNILYGFLDGIMQKNVFLAFCFVIRAFEALGSAATVTSGMAIVAQVFPDNVAQYDGMLELFSGFGFAIGPPLGSLFYGIGGYRLPFIVLGTTSLVLTIIDMWILPSVRSLSGEEKPGSLLNVARIPAIWVVLIGSVWSSACIGFIDPTLSVHLTNPPLKVSKSLVGVLFFLVGGGYGIMAPILGYIGDKTKATRIMMVLGFYFIGLSYMFLGPSPLLNLPKQLWVIIVALSLLGVSNSLASMPAFLDLILSAQWYGLPDDFSTQGVLSGLFNGSYALGTFIGPTLAGVLVDKVGFDWAVTVFAAGNFLIMIMIGLFSAWEFQWGKGKRKPEHLRRRDTPERLVRDESSINA